MRTTTSERKTLRLARLLAFFAAFLFTFNALDAFFASQSKRSHREHRELLLHSAGSSSSSSLERSESTKASSSYSVAKSSAGGYSSSSSSKNDDDGDDGVESGGGSLQQRKNAKQQPLEVVGKWGDFNPIVHAEYSGSVSKWGENNFKSSARECHDDCLSMNPDGKAVGDRACNVWVWCGDANGCLGQKYRACWLKHQARPEMAIGAKDSANPWTSGSLAPQLPTKGDPGSHRKFHTLVTTNANVYQAWQVRVMYFHWKKQKKICVEQETKEEPCQMGGFTRVLHDKPDSLMSEIPTCVVDRLDNEMGFVVLSRPNAFMQYFEKCDKIEETYVLMAEPDHVYIKPIPNLMIGERPAAFPFFYIEPSRWPTLVKRFVGNDKMSAQDIEKVDPIGSSPVFIRKDDLKRLAPVWVETTLAIKKDKEANRDWGWVLEMYGYTIAAYRVGLQHDLRPQLTAQPPWDKSIGDFLSIHFTYGMDYALNGTFTPGKFGQWRFDKRTYQNGIPPRDLLAPPEKSDNELVKLLISCINEASANIETWETFDGKNRVVHKGAQNQPNVKKKM